MQIYTRLEDIPQIKNPVFTLGTFDGVHVGHQKVIATLKEAASKNKGEPVLMTFYPHPRKVLHPEKNDLQLLSSLDEKISLLKKFGIRHLVIQPFTIEFSKMEHEDFVKEILVEKIGVKAVVIGYDHQFGHDRKGSFKELKQMAGTFGFSVEEIPEEDVDAIAVSSTRIRKALLCGDIETANHLLGYDYSLTGNVVEGNKLGRTLGFPTANIRPGDPDKLVPANGIYAVNAHVNNKEYKAVLSIGHRPTFDNGSRSIEVNLFEFDEDIYGKELTIIFKKFLRSELKFDSKEALIEQMTKDKAQSLELLENISVK